MKKRKKTKRQWMQMTRRMKMRKTAQIVHWPFQPRTSNLSIGPAWKLALLHEMWNLTALGAASLPAYLESWV